jgi:hypothetical protein
LLPVLQLLRRSVLRFVWRLPRRGERSMHGGTALRPSPTNCDIYADGDRNADAVLKRDRDSHRHRHGIADEYADPESIAKRNTDRDRPSLRG